jgi:CBS-domain-containing membrane protein
MKPLRVEELMRQCQAAIISETALLRHAAETLVVNNLSVLIATGDTGAMVGLIPEAAIIRHLMATPNRAETVSGILSRHIETVRPETDINCILHLFRSSCHAVVPVVNENKQVIGLLHRADVVRMLLENTVIDNDHPDKLGQKPHFLDRSELPKSAKKDVLRKDTGE